MPVARRAAFFCLFLALTMMVVVNMPVQAVPMQSEQQKVDLKYEEPSQTESPSVIWMIVQMLVALGLIVLLAWGAIQILGRKMNHRMQGRWIRVLDEVVLGQNRGIVVLEVGGRAFLVGITDHQISMLFEIEDQQLVQDMMASGYEENRLIGPGWDSFIQRFIKRHSLSQKGDSQEFKSLMGDKVRALERMAARIRELDDKD